MNTTHNLNLLKEYNTNIIELLLKNTRVVTKQEVETNILRLIEQWKAERDESRDLYVNEPTYYKGTGDDVGRDRPYTLFKEHLPEHTLITSSVRPTDGCEVLFINEWSLSGCTAAVAFEEVLYRSGLKDIKYTCIFNVSTKATESTLNRLIESDQYDNIQLKIYYDSIIGPLDDILKGEGIADSEIISFNKQVNPDTDCGSYPIVSEYKIPNQFGSYPVIYEKVWSVAK